VHEQITHDLGLEEQQRRVEAHGAAARAHNNIGNITCGIQTSV
jgi:hypothetical protein